MIAPACQHTKLNKHGKDRKGNQRWQCQNCRATVTKAEHVRPLGDMRIELSEAATVLKMLLEGMSIRACERITGMKRDTICDLVLHVGENCDRLLQSAVRGVASKFVEMDELWGFVHCKAKVADAKRLGPEVGDSWTWLAIDAETKLVLSHAVGKRDESTCVRFLKRLNGATVGRMQVTADGLSTYTHNVPYCLGTRVDFAQLIKTYASTQSETRYSPATIISAEKVARFGEPDMDHVSTSYSERLNLSVRMHVRRFTRLTNAHSKSAAHHEAMIALFVCWYNFARKHETLKGQTPAMASGLTSRVWSIEDLLTAAAQC
jgi:IS1 family transposase/transposase-like protein